MEFSIVLFSMLMCVLPMVSYGGSRSSKYREEVYMPYPVGKSGVYRHRVQCYQCAFSPSKTVYKTIKFPVEMKDFFGRFRKPKVIYRTKMVPLQKSGGWDKCVGPFSHYQAKHYGLDVWECNHNCYTRTDRNGNVFRGCYKGEFGVDPTKVGCSWQGGQFYCFCAGNKCNHGAAPSIGQHS